jgi:hypothetical protein
MIIDGVVPDWMERRYDLSEKVERRVVSVSVRESSLSV